MYILVHINHGFTARYETFDEAQTAMLGFVDPGSYYVRREYA
jgi:hypothetical protein